jgi:uncharacterized protein (AIM24 family)
MAKFDIEHSEGTNCARVGLIDETVVIERGAMSHMRGALKMKGKLAGPIRLMRAALSGEEALRPTISGTGTLYLESTFGGFHVMELTDGEKWVVESGAFWCSEARVKQTFHRERISTSFWSGKGFLDFQTKVVGPGKVMICSPGPVEEITLGKDSPHGDQLIADGYEYLFSANIDNLGATPDLRILGYIASHQIPFLMEVTARTDADRKGGHLAQASDGRLVLRESAQCPSADMDAFQDISRHRYFNTNNVWLALRPLRDLLAHYGGFLPLPIIVNRKTVDVRDATSPAVIQLESAMGAAIGLIAGAQAVAVPRQRFMPVKNCQDLLLLRSDRFMVNAQYHVVAVDERPLPTIHLDQRFYRVIADFEARFAPGIPRLHDCSALHVEGDITFAADVTISGDVILRAGDLAVHVAPHAFFTSGVHEIQ